MGVRVGLVGLRPELAVPAVAAVVAAGCEPVVVPAAGAGGAPAVGAGVTRSGPVGVSDDLESSPTGQCALLLVDVGAEGGQLVVPRADAWLQGRDEPATVVVHLPDEEGRAQVAAASVGASAVVELPTGTPWLVERLHPAAEAPPPALLVLGAVGGAGASTVAIACAAARPDCLLVDADPGSTGLDLPLGIEASAGGRWSAIPASAGPLVADSLRAALPVLGGVHVLTGSPVGPTDARPAAVVAAGRSGFEGLVIDLGRGPLPAWSHPQDPAIIVLPATLPGVLGARRLLGALGPRPVLLAPRPTPWLATAEVVEELGVDRVVEVPHLRRLAEAADCGDLLGGRVGRALRELGRRCWEGLS